MVRFGTSASRSERSSTLSLSSASAVKAVTATGTSCSVSSRLRAVTVTAPRLVALFAGVASEGAVSCAHATGEASADTSTEPIARLKYLRFIASPPAGHTCALRRTPATVSARLGPGARGRHRTFGQWDDRGAATTLAA